MPAARAIGRWLRAQLPLPGIAYLVVFVNTRCEQDCVHCFVRAEADDEILTPGELEAVGRHLSQLIQLTITGGEPTLRPDLPEAVAALARTSRVPFLSLHTNGFAPQRVERQVGEILRCVPESQISVRLSLDGFGPLHDEIRRRPQSWPRAVETLQRLQGLRRSEPRLRLFVDTVLSKRNEGRLRPLVEFLDAQTGNLDGRELLYLRGEPRDLRSAGVDGSSYRSALRSFCPDLARNGRGEVASSLPEWARREMYRQVLSVAEGRGRAEGCVAGRRFAVLGARGEVSACEMPAGGGVLGNIRTDGPDLHSILGGERGTAARARIHRGDCAEGCSYECAALATVALRADRLTRAALSPRPPAQGDE